MNYSPAANYAESKIGIIVRSAELLLVEKPRFEIYVRVLTCHVDDA